VIPTSHNLPRYGPYALEESFSRFISRARYVRTSDIKQSGNMQTPLQLSTGQFEALLAGARFTIVHGLPVAEGDILASIENDLPTKMRTGTMLAAQAIDVALSPCTDASIVGVLEAQYHVGRIDELIFRSLSFKQSKTPTIHMAGFFM